jgi:UDP-glucuronate 4-epimerase
MDITCLRFFTVYGPWGRPDMALFIFTDKILKGEPIDVFNHGKMRRDFTYVDDIVDGFALALEKGHGYEIINLGNSQPVELMDFIATIEQELGKKAVINFLPIQAGDVPETTANITKAKKLLGYEPKVNVQTGVKNFIEWYKTYYDVKL